MRSCQETLFAAHYFGAADSISTSRTGLLKIESVQFSEKSSDFRINYEYLPACMCTYTHLCVKAAFPSCNECSSCLFGCVESFLVILFLSYNEICSPEKGA